MMRLKMFFRTFLSVLVTMSMLAGTVQAALLDVGPVVPQVNPSTENPINSGIGLGHGFPLWYRDTNRVPLQICTDRASGMCLTAEPNPAAALNFPNNISDELFWYTADAIIDYPQSGILQRPGQAILVMAIEAAFSTGDVVPGAQVSFARIRIRIDTPAVGTYLVTTPYKQFSFTVDAAALGTDGRRAINHTEDIGIAEGGVFTGALNGSIGPFLYCTNAPIVNAFGSFIGDPNVPCTALGSTFNPPSLPGPANYFRIQGPNGFDVQSNQFAISGKLYTDPIPTPLNVDKATYSRDSARMQVSTHATTQALSNQVNGALAFPQNFALTGAPSVVQYSGAGVPVKVMATSTPADGKFFGSNAAASIPTEIVVSNTADTPVTTKIVPLVDEVVVSAAKYNPTTKVLTVNATSLDAVAQPALQVFMPDATANDGKALLGTISNGALNVTFPVTVAGKQYPDPTATVIVSSANGGSETADVAAFIPGPVTPATGVTLQTVPATPQLTNTQIVLLASATGGVAPHEYSFWIYNNNLATWTEARGYSASNSYVWTPTVAGTYVVQARTRSAGSSSVYDSVTQSTYRITTPAVTSVSLSPSLASPRAANTTITFTASATGGVAPQQYEFWLYNNTAGTWTNMQAFSTTNTWSWTPAVAGGYVVQVRARSAGSTAVLEAFSQAAYTITP